MLLEASPLWLRPIIGVAAFTGMRRSEILGLRWLDVDCAHRRIMLRQTKNGDGRMVNLNGSAVAALASVRSAEATQATDLVFADITGDQVTVAFGRLCRAQRISDFRFHDLRHTAASWLIVLTSNQCAEGDGTL